MTQRRWKASSQNLLHPRADYKISVLIYGKFANVSRFNFISKSHLPLRRCNAVPATFHSTTDLPKSASVFMACTLLYLHPFFLQTHSKLLPLQSFYPETSRQRYREDPIFLVCYFLVRFAFLLGYLICITVSLCILNTKCNSVQNQRIAPTSYHWFCYKISKWTHLSLVIKKMINHLS